MGLLNGGRKHGDLIELKILAVVIERFARAGFAQDLHRFIKTLTALVVGNSVGVIETGKAASADAEPNLADAESKLQEKKLKGSG